MAPAVARQENELHALDPADQQFIGRRSPGRVDRDPLRVLKLASS